MLHLQWQTAALKKRHMRGQGDGSVGKDATKPADMSWIVGPTW